MLRQQVQYTLRYNAMMIKRKYEYLTAPAKQLDSLAIGKQLNVPNSQRVSVNGTIQRIKDRSDKRFTIKRINDDYFIIVRIK